MAAFNSFASNANLSDNILQHIDSNQDLPNDPNTCLFLNQLYQVLHFSYSNYNFYIKKFIFSIFPGLIAASSRKC